MTTRGVSGSCVPRWGTPRRPERASWGPAVGRIAKTLGKPLLPWQQHVADVALEIDPDTGRLVYRDVRLTVPRQSGKTTLVLPVVIWRVLCRQSIGGRQRIVYSAQTRQKARKKWTEEYIPIIKECRQLRGKYKTRMSNGDELMQFLDGSLFSPESTQPDAGHGDTLDMAIQDEAFSLVDNRMDQAFRPPMITRPSPQYWVVSTAGTAESLYLIDKVAEGRKAVEGGLDRGVAYFEWSAHPDADPGDVETWRSCMPSLGHLFDEEVIRAEYNAMKVTEFARAYLNVWATEVTESAIPLAWWGGCENAEATITGDPVLSVDVSPMSTSATLLIAGQSTAHAEATHLEVIRNAEGTDWIVPVILGIQDRRPTRGVVLDDAGPAGQLITPLKKAGVDVNVISGREYAQSCAQLHAGARDGTITHLGDPIFVTALKGAATRQLGDMWAWRRRTSTADITPIVAATVALWGHQTVEKKQILVTGGWV